MGIGDLPHATFSTDSKRGSSEGGTGLLLPRQNPCYRPLNTFSCLGIPASMRLRLFFLPLILFAAGCPPGVVTDRPPDPGTMRLFSVEPLPAAGTGIPNLLPNGRFIEWYAGSPVLRGFDLPADTSISVVLRRSVRMGVGGQAAEQIWYRTDGDLPPQGLFRSTLRGIKPETAYQFEVTAIPMDDLAAQACIGVWGLGQGSVTELGRPLVRLGGVPGTRVTRTGQFKTHADPLLILGAYLDRPPSKECRVIWLEWRLSESASD